MASPVLRFPADCDLTPLRRALWAAKINHLYRQQDDMQLILLTDGSQYADAMALVERWNANESLDHVNGKTSRVSNAAFSQVLKHVPICVGLIVSCVIVFALMQIDQRSVISALAITPITYDAYSATAYGLDATLHGFQLWRLFTPILMHFSVMHIVFNLLWVWFFGRQLEPRLGKLRFILLTLFAGLVSNLLQYVAGGAMFGGMSGVIYAYLGFTWLSNRLSGQAVYPLPPMLMAFMLIWMILGMTPMFSALGFGEMANEAHLGGLLAGLAAAVIARVFGRLQQ